MTATSNWRHRHSQRLSFLDLVQYVVYSNLKVLEVKSVHIPKMRNRFRGVNYVLEWKKSSCRNSAFANPQPALCCYRLALGFYIFPTYAQ
jgi:hypothetical protein